MIRSGKKSKDSSPAPSRGSSLRGASASDAKRTILNLQNDDWTDEELAAAELQEEKDQIGDASDASLEPLDLAAVAQLMKSTVRKRSPKVCSNFFVLLLTLKFLFVTLCDPFLYQTFRIAFCSLLLLSDAFIPVEYPGHIQFSFI